jgi:hypothetical protein
VFETLFDKAARRMAPFRSRRARGRMERRWRGRQPPSFEDLVRRMAPGRSFVDFGGLWGIHGEMAFTAEAAGATRVTLVDAAAPTDEYEQKHRERGSSVRYVCADLHDTATPERVGAHDVVWCTGVMYHTPSPGLAVWNLARMASETVVIGTKVIPEIPGYPNAGVYFPGLERWERETYAPFYEGGVTAEFDTEPKMFYGNWFWGFSESAFCALVKTYLEIVETIELPYFDTRDNFLVVARVKA